MKRLWIVVGVLALAGGYAAYQKWSLTASDEFLPTTQPLTADVTTPKKPAAPAGKPGPPADVSKVTPFLTSWWMSNGTDKNIDLQTSFCIANEGKVPVQNVVIEIGLTYQNDPDLKKNFVMDLKNINAAYGTSTQGVLFPGQVSDQWQSRDTVPIEYWRRDTMVTIRVIEAEVFDDRSNLEEPMQLQAFILESPTAKIKEGFAANPKLKDVKSSFGRGPLQFALMQKDLEKVKLFESMGFDLNKPVGWNEGPYHFAVFSGPKMIEYLHSRGAKSTVASFNKLTPTHYATNQWDVNVFSALKKAGISLDGQTDEGKTPLILAAEIRDLDVAEALIKAGARQDLFTTYNTGFMGNLIYSGRTDFLDRALKIGGSLKETAPNGYTLLHHAAKSGRFNSIRWLLGHGADPKAKDKAGAVPLDLITNIINTYDRETIRELLTTPYKKK